MAGLSITRRRAYAGWLGSLMILAASGANGATVHVWNPTAGNLTDFIASNAWTQAGDHVIEIGTGTYSGSDLGVWSGNIIWENMGTRAASSITIRGASRAGTVIQGTGNFQNGVNRVNNTDMTGVTFERLTFEVSGSGSLFGQWQNGGKPADVTFRDTNVVLGTGALIGRTNFATGRQDGSLTFDNSFVYTQTNTILGQWDFNAGRPLAGMVNGSGNSAFFLGSLASGTFDGDWAVNKFFSIGAGNGPEGGASGYANNFTGSNADGAYGGFVTGFLTANPVPGSGLAAIGTLGLAGMARRRRR